VLDDLRRKSAPCGRRGRRSAKEKNFKQCEFPL
jgi:hypothetical protein